MTDTNYDYVNESGAIELASEINDIEQTVKELPEFPLSVENGGTGASNTLEAQYNLLQDMYQGSQVPKDDEEFLTLRANPTREAGVFMRKSFTLLWTWIENKMKSIFGFTDDHKLPADKIDGLTNDCNFYIHEVTPRNTDNKEPYCSIDVYSDDLTLELFHKIMFIRVDYLTNDSKGSTTVYFMPDGCYEEDGYYSYCFQPARLTELPYAEFYVDDYKNSGDQFIRNNIKAYFYLNAELTESESKAINDAFVNSFNPVFPNIEAIHSFYSYNDIEFNRDVAKHYELWSCVNYIKMNLYFEANISKGTENLGTFVFTGVFVPKSDVRLVGTPLEHSENLSKFENIYPIFLNVINDTSNTSVCVEGAYDNTWTKLTINSISGKYIYM